MSDSCSKPEFCRINIDFKKFKLNNTSFHSMTGVEPEYPVPELLLIATKVMLARSFTLYNAATVI